MLDPRPLIQKSTSRNNFPLLSNHPELIYLDSAATTLIPDAVLQAYIEGYSRFSVPIHRSIYSVAVQATEQYEAVREQTQRFLGATSSDEIIFTHNATEGLNLAAYIEQQRLQRNDEIIISEAEHHSNLLPWQRVAKETGARLVWLPAHENGYFPLNALQQAVSSKTKLITVSAISNVLGYISPLAEISQLAKQAQARLVVDAAQALPLVLLTINNTPVDYAVFSGHKMYGPEGSGYIYMRQGVAEDAEPLLIGGGTINDVSLKKTTWAEAPLKFEAGSPSSAGVIGLGAAIKYLGQQGFEDMQHHLSSLTEYGLQHLSQIPGLTLYGPATKEKRAPIFSFSLKVKDKALHSHDICQIADEQHVALRGGHHCAQPLMQALGVEDLTRASCGIYTTTEDIDSLVKALWTCIEKLS